MSVQGVDGMDIICIYLSFIQYSGLFLLCLVRADLHLQRVLPSGISNFPQQKNVITVTTMNN